MHTFNIYLMRLTKEEFIKKSIKVHGNKYDYSETEYINLKTPIKIKYNNIAYMQLPSNHLKGFKPENNKKMSREEFINKAVKKHGNKYDYSLLNFKNVRGKIKVIYNNVVYEQFAYAHLAGKCPERPPIMKTNEQFILESKKVHGDLFDYSLVEYTGNHNKVNIIYNDKVYKQSAIDHIRGIYPDGCGLSDSRGVRVIKKILNDNNVKYVNEYSYSDCRHINILKFDFYLPEYDILIEYDGRQHFESYDYFGGVLSYELTKKRDEIKNKYVMKNNINLIRISYKDDIKSVLREHINIIN